MIYVVRHGQTNWNLQGRCQGWQDDELNQTGVEQAQTLAKQLAGIKFDVCFASPLKRALKTAQIVYRGEVIVDPRLRERGKGEFEGQLHDERKKLGIDFDDPQENRYGIETLPNFQKRIGSFWDEILKKYVGKNVLVVTHYGTVVWSQVYLCGLPKDQVCRLDNCGVWQIDNNSPVPTVGNYAPVKCDTTGLARS